MDSKEKHLKDKSGDPEPNSEDDDKEDEETFLAKYKLNGEIPKKIPYNHDLFKPSPPIQWDDLKSFKERMEKGKDAKEGFAGS
jgi:hypothetical protein